MDDKFKRTYSKFIVNVYSSRVSFKNWKLFLLPASTHVQQLYFSYTRMQRPKVPLSSNSHTPSTCYLPLPTITCSFVNPSSPSTAKRFVFIIFRLFLAFYPASLIYSSRVKILIRLVLLVTLSLDQTFYSYISINQKLRVFRKNLIEFVTFYLLSYTCVKSEIKTLQNDQNVK